MLRRGMMAQAASGGGSYLDSLAVTPRMALSMKKKLISTATSALRVRESAGNTEQDIGFSGALVDSAALASFVGANSGFLRTLYDQTGNSENAVQATSANPLNVVVHSTYGAGYGSHAYAVSAGASVQLSILADRSLTGAGEIAVWQGGTLLTATPSGPQADQTGVFSSYDAYIGSRGGSSLFSDMALESLVTYNADTSAIRTAIEAILA